MYRLSKEIEALQNENKELRNQLSQLHLAVLRINDNLDLGNVLSEIVNRALELSDALYGCIGYVNEEGKAIDFVFAGFTPEEHERLRAWPDGPRLFEVMRRIDGTLTYDDLPDFARAQARAMNLFNTESFVGTPLYRGEGYFGHFFLMGKRNGEEFSREDKEILLLFGSQAATTIANACTHRNEQRARLNLAALIDTSPVGVVVLNVQKGTVEVINREARRLLRQLAKSGQSLEQLVDEVTFRRADGREISLLEIPTTNVLTTETVRSETIELSVPDGQSISVLLNATPIGSATGVVESVIVTLQDLAPLQELELLRTEFISMVSHELRAPLTSIIGSTSTILGKLSTLESGELVQYIRIIDTQAEYMRGLINDLLDVGRIELGTLSVEPQPWEVLHLVEQAREIFGDSGQRHSVLINLPTELPPVMADKQRIVQVLNNLLVNAANHSSGKTKIRVEAHTDSTHVAISVSDEGIGISPELLPRLFEKNFAIGDEAEQTLRSTGLGLTICKGLVEAHGGRIWAESGGIGQGAQFTFTLPIAGMSATSGLSLVTGTGNATDAYDHESARILVVDDDPYMLRHVKDALTEANHVSIVTGSHDNLSQIIRSEKPDLVLLDLVLPGVSGIELMNRIPEIADLPVILISGYTKDDTIAQALDAGAVDYIVKPFSATELNARVRAALRKRTDPESFVLGELRIMHKERRVTVSGRPIHLTPLEYELLRFLSLTPESVVSHSSLIRNVWRGRGYATNKLVRAVVMNLRKKLGDDPNKPTYIVNVHGVGYRLAFRKDYETVPADNALNVTVG